MLVSSPQLPWPLSCCSWAAGDPSFSGLLGANAAVAAQPRAATARVPEVAQLHRIVLKTGMFGSRMVYLDLQGKPNPVLRANVGDTVEITLSAQGAEHIVKPQQLESDGSPWRLSVAPMMEKRGCARKLLI